jgi:hypothetical protein
MAVIIVDEDGQSFYSPTELDAFTYFRDYILKRTFKEFFQLNPGAAEEGWVDVLSQSWWEIDDDDSDYAQWDGDNILFTGQAPFGTGEFSILAVLRDWPDSPPQLPWTRYTRPSRIRFTIKRPNGSLKSIRCDSLSYIQTEFMEEFDVGVVNLPDGFIFPIDPEAPIVGDNDHIRSFKFKSVFGTGGLIAGDRITKMEFNYDPIPKIDYTNIWNQTIIPEVTEGGYYIKSCLKSDGTPILQVTERDHLDRHAIWNGISWDEYYLPVSGTQSYNDDIGADDFGNVHYFQRTFLRTTWSLSGGFYEQDIDFNPTPTDQWQSPYTGRHTAIDPNGYCHLVYRARTTSPFRYYVGHYYQDASGWHNEEIFDIGDNNLDDYPWHHQYCEHLDMKIDTYGKIHVFIELSMRDLVSIWDLDPFVMYITNSRTGGWTSQILAPWGLGDEANEGRQEITDIYVDPDNDNYMTGFMGGRSVPTYFVEKTWTASNWTFTYLVPAGDDFFQSVKIGNIYHLLGNIPPNNLPYDINAFQYLKYDGEAHEIIKRDEYMFIYTEKVGSRVDWYDCQYLVKDGNPVLVSPPGLAEIGFAEQEINE